MYSSCKGNHHNIDANVAKENNDDMCIERKYTEEKDSELGRGQGGLLNDKQYYRCSLDNLDKPFTSPLGLASYATNDLCS